MQKFGCFVYVFFLLGAGWIQAAELRVGRATVDISPERPICLQGMFHTRISDEKASPLSAVLLDIQSYDGDTLVDEAFFVALDICFPVGVFVEEFRAKLAEAEPEFDSSKLIVSATHTHTSYSLDEDYLTDREDVMTREEVRAWIIDKLVPAIIDCRRKAEPCQFSFGLGYATVAHCRQTVYSDGDSIMYGPVNTEKFDSFEAGDDAELDMMFFEDLTGKLLAVGLCVPCPAQCVESWNVIHADYWYEVRQRMAEEFGPDVAVLGLCGCAGDMSPHPLLNRGAEERMQRMRDLDEKGEIARRIVREVVDSYPVIRQTAEQEITLNHTLEAIDVPLAAISDEMMKEAKEKVEQLRAQIETEPDHGAASGAHLNAVWQQSVVDRWQRIQDEENPTYKVPLHALRIGDLAVVTNPFELYSNYARQIKGRSVAVQTMTVQLADPADVVFYLPTQQSTERGGYGASPFSYRVGPNGGKQIVEQLIQMIQKIFP